MRDGFEWWRAALAGKAPEIMDGRPENGFYRIRRGRNGPWLPVAIFTTAAGEHVALVGAERKREEPSDIWTWCAKHPVAQADCKHAFANANQWPSDAPTIGDNADRAGVGPLELLRDYMETARAWFAKVGTIDTQQKVDQAANYAAELAKRKTDADKDRDAKVRPHLEAQREINGQYKPTIDDASALGMEIKRACDAYLIAEKRRKEAEAAAKYEAERKAAEAERKRIEAEREKQMRDDPIAALTSPEPELPMPPSLPGPVKVHAGGQRGRRMSLRTVTVYEIANYDDVVAWAVGRPEVVEYLTKIATAAARAGEDVPGVVKRTEERAA